MHELENLFEGTSDEEREAAEVVAGAIAGGSVSAEEALEKSVRPLLVCRQTRRSLRRRTNFLQERNAAHC
jgi:hypothetical protein